MVKKILVLDIFDDQAIKQARRLASTHRPVVILLGDDKTEVQVVLEAIYPEACNEKPIWL